MLVIAKKDNINISAVRIGLEIAIVFSSIYTAILTIIRPQNTMISDRCLTVMEINDSE